MSDLFSINVASVSSSGENINAYGQELKTLLDDFDDVITTLTTSGMTGYMSDRALEAYNSVKENLATYATALINVGSQIQESANASQNTATVTGDNIFVQ